MTASVSRSLAKRLSRRVLQFTVLIFVIVLILFTVISDVTSLQESKKFAAKSLEKNIMDIRAVLNSVESSTKTISAMADKVSDKRLAAESLMKLLAETNEHINSCAIAFSPEALGGLNLRYVTMASKDSAGNIITHVLDNADYDYMTMDWYQIPKLLGESYWNDPAFEEGSDRMITTYSMPIYSGDGDFIGVIRSDINLEWLTEVANNSKPFESAFTIVIGKNGSFITHVDKSKILNETIFSDAFERNSDTAVEESIKVMNGESGFSKMRMGNDLYYSVYAPIPNGWRIAGLCSYIDFYRNSVNIEIFFTLIAILSLVILYFTTKKMISRQIQPITEFTYSAMNMSRGNFNASIPDAKTQDEIGNLRSSLSYLQKTINQYIFQLRDATSRKERIESELQIASAIQMSMLPHQFVVGNDVDLFASLTPAKEVGGDLYDFKRIGNILYFAIGDVSGKGVPAALFMAITRSSSNFTSGMSLKTSEMVSMINNTFADGNETGMFVTLFIAKINLDTMEMEYCNGGHNPIIIISPDGKAKFLKAKPNIAVGLFPGFEYESESLILEKGCRILAYTDGVSEAETADKDQYGDDRLLEFANNIPADISSKGLVAGLLDSVRGFTKGNEQNDDITILAVKL